MGIIFYYLLGINNNIAPKHLSYFLPFWSIMLIAGMQQLINMKGKIKKFSILVFSLLLVFQFLIGFKVSFKNLPYADRKSSILYPEPEIIKLKRLYVPFNSINYIDIVLGTGTLIPTADELTPSSGIIFNPINWYAQKNKLAESYSSLEKYILSSNQDSLYFLITDGSTQFTLNALLSNGYHWLPDLSNFKGEPKKFILRKQNKIATLYRFMGFRKFDVQSFIDNFEKMPVNKFIVVFLWDWQNYMMEEMLNYLKYNVIASNGYEISF